jgi:adenosylcobinamide-phosphate synthase
LSLLALVVALLAQHAWPLKGRNPLLAFYGRLAIATAKRLDAGDRNSGVLAWCVLMAVVLVPVMLVTAVVSRIHPALLFVLDTAVLYATLRFLATTAELGAVQRALRDGDVAAASQTLAAWRGEPVDADDASAVARLAAEHALREAHHGAFAPLFWFLVLPGPLGLVMYPLARRAARTWAAGPDPEGSDFGWFAAQAFHVIDWIPQRLTAFAFAVVGNFEDALFCWRSQAATWLQPEEGIVLASGAGALGVRLGDPVPRSGGFVPRPPLGLGEPAREEALASLEGLLWRALVVWMIAFLLAAGLALR